MDAQKQDSHPPPAIIPPDTPPDGINGIYVRRVLIAVGISVAVVGLLALLWYAIDVLLVVFAGTLVAVLLRAPANLLARHTPLSGGWSVGVVIIALALLLWGGGRLMAPTVMDQFDTLSRTLPQVVETAKQQVTGNPWGDRLLRQAQSINWRSPRMNLLGRVTGAVSSVFGFLANVGIILVLGVYFAIQPRPYIDGLVKLVPVPGRSRAREVLRGIGQTLQWWMVGKLASMALIGVLTGLGLWLLGIQLALALAVLAGLLSFVPYLGPIVSAVPAVLLAFTQGSQQAFYVILLFLGVQAIEGNVLTPLVQQKAVNLPAAMILFAQIMLGVLLGAMGVVLATPLAAMLFVVVRMLYVEGVLGDTDGAG